jgi:hypothetical protein
LYSAVIWSDGDDKSLTYWEKQSLIDFANVGNPNRKTTLIAASQEMIRSNDDMSNKFNTELQSNVLRSVIKEDGFYDKTDDIKIRGYYHNLDFVINIVPTTFLYDRKPQAGIFSIKDTVYGQNYVAYYYHPVRADRPRYNDNLSAISSKMLDRNLVYSAVDWRHLANATAFLSGILSDVGKDLQNADDSSRKSLDLLDFSTKSIGRKVMLNWTTANEIDTKDFDIERANTFNTEVVGIFNKIGNENALGLSKSKNYYSNIDNNVIFNQQYAYRLKINSFDGQYTYSPLRFVDIEYSSGITIDDPTPNPSSNDLVRVNYNLPKESSVRIVLYDLSGRELMVVYEGTRSVGSNSVEIDVTGLSAGIYNLRFVVDGMIVEKSTAINIIK